MAKGKGGKSESTTSAGTRRSSMRTRGFGVSDMEKLLNKQKAFMKGSNPWMTIENPNKSQTNKPYIKVRMSDLRGGSFKDIQKRSYMMK
jgi:hypothetical protein